MSQVFEWDPVKAASNRAKLGIDFAVARQVFTDPLAVTDYDRTVGSEDRWRTIGLVGRTLLLVIHTSRHEIDGDGNLVEVIRMISARKAQPRERRRHEAKTE